MTKLSTADVQKLARLSRLKLTKAEITQFQAELGAILGYVEQLESVNTGDLAPTSQVTGLRNVVRSDTEINYGVSVADLLANAPASEQHIKVKRMIG